MPNSVNWIILTSSGALINIWVMLNSVSGHLLILLKNEIKEKFNIEKITFYFFKVLKAYISKQIFYLNMFNYCPRHFLAFSLIFFYLLSMIYFVGNYY
jgi:hypothetical protein